MMRRRGPAQVQRSRSIRRHRLFPSREAWRVRSDRRPASCRKRTCPRSSYAPSSTSQTWAACKFGQRSKPLGRLPGRMWTGTVRWVPATVKLRVNRNVGRNYVPHRQPGPAPAAQHQCRRHDRGRRAQQRPHIAARCVHMDDSKPYVFRIVGDRVKRQNIQFSLQNLTRVEITSGPLRRRNRRAACRGIKSHLRWGDRSRSFPEPMEARPTLRSGPFPECSFSCCIAFSHCAASPLKPPQLLRKNLLASGHVDEAIRVLQSQSGKSSTDAESYNLLCRAYFMLEDWDAAISNCERASSLAPQNSLLPSLARPHLRRESGPGWIFPPMGLAKKVRARIRTCG